MHRGNYSFSNNDSKTFKRFKEIFLREKNLTDYIDIDKSDIVIEIPTNEKMNNVETEIQLERQESNKEVQQFLNCFPKKNNKHIDYVIYYKETVETQSSKEIKTFRSKFFKKLKQDGFDLDYIRQPEIKNEKTKGTYVYVLLNCSLDRLMDEAERMELELPLKLVSIITLKQYFKLINTII